MLILSIISIIMMLIFSPVDWLVKTTGMDMAAAWAVGGVGTWVIAWVLKRIPNKAIKARLGSLFFGFGVVVSAFFGGKWQYTKPFWEKLIEPFVIDAIDNFVVNSAVEFIRGMRSDN